MSDTRECRLGFDTEEEVQAFLDLAEKYRDRIYRLALYCTGDPVDAEQVLEQTFRAAQVFPSAIRQNGSLYQHLIGAAVEETLAKLRERHGAEFAAAEENNDGELPLPQEIVDWGDTQYRYTKAQLETIVRESIKSLEAPLRLPLVLRDVERVSISAVAKMLKLSEPATRMRLLRARLELRERLNSYFRSA